VDVLRAQILLLAVWRSREAETAERIEDTTTEVLRREEGIGLIVSGWARAVLYNSLGWHEDTLTAAQPANEERPENLGVSAWVLVEVVEAATRSGRAGGATNAFSGSGRQVRLVAPTGRWAWRPGSAAAEPNAHPEAIERLGRTRVRGELARSHLVYGVWLRREGRPLDARAELRTAHEMLTAMEMYAFAPRASCEPGANTCATHDQDGQ
jgi:hypothetical protein